MNALRPLLRLDDKVAAEGRRLQQLGGPPLRWAVPLAFVLAAAVHASLLMLPVAQTRTVPPSLSLATDFPVVWRPAIAVPPPPTPVQASRSKTTPPVLQNAETKILPPVVVARPVSTEPVPEPAPELALTMISADVEAIIPNPDPPPTQEDVGPHDLAVSGGAPSVIEQVDPVYPPAARSTRAEGKVILRLFVMPDGSVGRATVVGCSRPGFGFEAAALAAVKRWRYEPAPLQSGTRTANVTIHFQQQDARP
jgi:protein TonB